MVGWAGCIFNAALEVDLEWSRIGLAAWQPGSPGEREPRGRVLHTGMQVVILGRLVACLSRYMRLKYLSLIALYMTIL